MEDLLNGLNNLTPVIAVGSIAIFMTLERWLPYFEHGAGRGPQRLHNLGIVAIAFLINATLGGVMLLPVIWADANHFGLMYRIGVWPPFAMLLGVFPDRPVCLRAARLDALGSSVLALSPGTPC
jgi:hypothetical protein